ncbi:preprotein translocase subunit YajC [Gimesia sp.]|uniref:preprotein translocase subunit YajC n=1 Tax=Gimesia sp. TaxID=2024833 RepID=UPI000C653FC4|nr:preprotein translocase subunit YajC [Gimesia sp.]MAX39880.1 preprotein translocase subunit YajC [Gimesia sp.]HAH47266.1 preprotein translocase subunit YajC [Planctomycetaceae bacterium]
MNNLLETLYLFAQDAPVKEGPAASPFLQFLPLIAIVIFFYFIMFRPQQKERAKREAALGQLKKNDRVVTIGGIIGTIANIAEQEQEVTLKVDDNLKIKVRRSAIQGLYQVETKETTS